MQEDHDLFSLISSKFLDDSTYCIPAVAATARLVFSCSTTSSVCFKANSLSAACNL